MACFQNGLLLAVLCIFAGALTEASDAEDRPPHIIPPHYPPHIIPPHYPHPPHIPHGTPSTPQDAPSIPLEASPMPHNALPILHEVLPIFHEAQSITLEAPPIPQDKPHDHDIPDWINLDSGVHWTPCDIDAGPRTRCHDCHTRLICTLFGGLVLDCPYASYCNNGVCLHVPRVECV